MTTDPTVWAAARPASRAEPTNGAGGTPRPAGLVWRSWDALRGEPGPWHGPRRDHPDGTKDVPWPPGLDGHALADLVYVAGDALPPAGASVIVTEGEKAADAAAETGAYAIGTVGGASSTPGPAVVALLTRYLPTLSPDADTPGRDHMGRLAGALERAGLPTLRLIDPPAEAPRGWDLADAAPGDRRALIAGARELLGFGLRDEPPEEERPSAIIGLPLAEFLAEAAAGVAYLADGAIVDGGLVVFVGRPETFKTMALLDLGLAAAGAAPSWLGLALGPARPFVYVSNEKSPATVRERFRRMADHRPPTEPVHIIHRRGVTFGDRERWDSVLAVVSGFGRSCVVGCDTLASLAGAGFDENSGRDMAVALAALRRLTDTGATVLLGHHPAKHGEGTGGIRMRGHTSLWGEVDGVLEFTRPDRAEDSGVIRIEPKDADLRIVRFEWSRDTFLLEPADSPIMTARAIAATVAALFTDEPIKADAIRAQFPGHGRTAFADRLGEAVDAGLLRRVGRGKATGYCPSEVADDWSGAGSPR